MPTDVEIALAAIGRAPVKRQDEQEPNTVADVTAMLLKSAQKESPMLVEAAKKAAESKAGKAALYVPKKAMTGLGWLSDKMMRASIAPLTGAIHETIESAKQTRPIDFNAPVRNITAEEPKYFGQVVRDVGIDTNTIPGRALAGTLNVVADPLLYVNPMKNVALSQTKVAKALGKSRVVKELRPYFTDTTGIPEVDEIIERQKQMRSYAENMASRDVKGLQDKIETVARQTKKTPNEVKALAMEHANIPVRFGDVDPERTLLTSMVEEYQRVNKDSLAKEFGNPYSQEAIKSAENEVRGTQKYADAVKRHNATMKTAQTNFEIKKGIPKSILGISEDLTKLANKASEIDLLAGKNYLRLPGYQYQKLTPEAREYILSIEKPGSRSEYDVLSDFFKHEQRRSVRNKTIQQANELARTGQLEEMPGFRGRVFEDDPVYLAAQRLKSSYETGDKTQIMSEASRKYGISTDYMDELVKDNKALLSAKQAINNPKVSAEDFEKAAGTINKIEKKYQGKALRPDNYNASEYELVSSKFLPGKAKEGGISKQYFPKEIAKALNKTDEIYNPGFIGKWWDKLNRTYKLFQLSNPANMARDLGPGNYFQAELAGVHAPQLTKEWAKAAKAMKKGEFKVAGLNNEDSMAELFRQRVIGGNRIKSETQLPKTDIKGNTLFSKMGVVGRATKKPFELFREWRNPIEDSQRAAFYKILRERGLSENQAGEVFRKHFFDYSDLTKFEKSVLQRIVPFYGWSRKNLPLMAENLVKQPSKMTAVNRFAQGMGDTGEKPDEYYMTPWQVASEPVYLGGDKAKGTYAATSRVFPSSDVIELLGKGMSGKEIAAGIPKELAKFGYTSTAPWIQTPLNIAMNFNPYFESKIRTFEGEKVPFLGMQVDPRMAELTKMFGPIQKALIAGRSNLTKGQKALRLIGGLNTFDYEVEKGARGAVSEQKKEIIDLKRKINGYRKILQSKDKSNNEKQTAADNWKKAAERIDKLKHWETQSRYSRE